MSALTTPMCAIAASRRRRSSRIRFELLDKIAKQSDARFQKASSEVRERVAAGSPTLLAVAFGGLKVAQARCALDRRGAEFGGRAARFTKEELQRRSLVAVAAFGPIRAPQGAGSGSACEGGAAVSRIAAAGLAFGTVHVRAKTEAWLPDLMRGLQFESPLFKTHVGLDPQGETS